MQPLELTNLENADLCRELALLLHAGVGIGDGLYLLAEEEKTELAAGIEARTAAYISEQAAQMGVAITASVETKVDGNGIPVPWEATLEGENSPVLAERIERELGIPQERQVWKCED